MRYSTGFMLGLVWDIIALELLSHMGSMPRAVTGTSEEMKQNQPQAQPQEAWVASGEITESDGNGLLAGCGTGCPCYKIREVWLLRGGLLGIELGGPRRKGYSGEEKLEQRCRGECIRSRSGSLAGEASQGAQKEQP